MKKHFAIEALETRIAPAVIFAVEANTNKLVSFDSAAPGTLITDNTITGLQASEIIAGIDFRPVTGELYALGIVDNGANRTGRIYILNTTTAVATQVGNAAFLNTLADTEDYGFDFNPVADRIRIVSSADNSYRVNPDTGGLVATDTNVDNTNGIESVVSVAYTGGKGSAVTTLYGYNFLTDNLVLIGGVDGNPSPNAGAITQIGAIRINGQATTFNDTAGLDIAALVGGPEQGWFIATEIGNSTTSLFTLDLATAAAVKLGNIGDGTRDFTSVAVSRFAPAPTISADSKSATWTDTDGDLVTLKITKGVLTPAAFTMLAGQAGSALAKLTITDPVFAGTNITLTAKPGANGGDGAVNVGTIDATGRDLGTVTIPGDLSVVLAGDANMATAGVKSLAARSIAKQAGQLLDLTGNFISAITGPLGSLKIAGDFAGYLSADKISVATIGGNIVGQEPLFGGFLSAGTMGSVTVKGSLLGDSQNSVRIVAGNITSIAVGGDLVGGNAQSSGSVEIASATPAKITIGGSLLGGSGDGSGGIKSTGAGALSISVKGSVIRESGSPGSATVAFAGPATIAIGGSFIGSELTGDFSSGILKSLTIGGNLESDTGTTSGIAVSRIGKLLIKGSVIGKTGAPAVITAAGNLAPANQAAALAIGSITIGGSVTHGFIGAGYFGNSSAIGDAAIGTIKIAGDVAATNILAGVNPVNAKFGDTDDIMQANVNGLAVVAKIASITIGGTLYGTAGGPTDTFGILAEQIGALTVGKIKAPLTTAKDNVLIGFTGDVRVREI